MVRGLEVWTQSGVGNWVQIFLSADKNPARKATEMGSKRLLDVLQHLLGDEIDLHAMRAEGVIFVDWVPLVRLTAHADASYTLEWADELVAQFAINKAAVSAALEASASDGGGGAALRARIAATPWRP